MFSLCTWWSYMDLFDYSLNHIAGEGVVVHLDSLNEGRLFQMTFILVN